MFNKQLVHSLTGNVQKIPFEDNYELTLTLGLMSFGIWYLFDRTGAGLGLGITIAFCAASVVQMFAFLGR